MITITDDAKLMLGGILADAQSKDRKDKRCLRIVSRDAVFGVGMDSPRDGDRVVDYNGKPLLLIDKDVDVTLSGATIAARQTAGGQKLVIARAKAS